MREPLVWFWFLALIGELSGCTAMVLKLTPLDRKQPELIWWVVAFVLIGLEVPAYFAAIRLRDGPANVNDLSLALTVLGRWLWTAAVWIMVLFVFRKIGKKRGE